MRITRSWLFATLMFVLAGCAATSSSRIDKPAAVSAWSGPVLISELPAPAGLKYETIGTVKATARAAYDSAPTLYPVLADEARKIGANAVLNAQEGHAASVFSVAAPFVSGMAVRVEDASALKKLEGTFY
jgi:hypothetical protein